MKTANSRQKKKRYRCFALLLPLLLTLITLSVPFNRAIAQRGNFSDWHVPPPLAPGNLTKGNTTGKGAKSSAVLLVPVDIPAPQLPRPSPVRLPQLAAISTTAPQVNTPDQPVISGGNTAGAEIPSPTSPDAPSMPQQALQDAVVTATIDLPDPTAPDLPPVPAEPVPIANATNIKTYLPLMPGVIERASPSFPAEPGLNYWSTPQIRENTPGDIVAPAANPNNSKGTKTKKVRPKPTKN